jgi:hypothetical protein
MKSNIFTAEGNLKIHYYSNSKVFKPTRTSSLIIKAINKNKKKFNKKLNILDLGCGSGIIGITLKKSVFKNANICFSDFSKNSVKATKKSLALNRLNCEVRKSNLMKNWKKKNFDLIINDVSGISSFFPKKNFWYNKFIPCDAGIDGTKQTFNFFKSLNKKNILVVIPLISLSNVSKIKKYLIKKKIKFSTLLKEDWPLPRNLVKKYLKDLISLKKKKIIYYKEKFGMLIANTEVLLIKL